jgi:peptidoglycan hydrolase-like protein with peptidoglycan-binding domain
MQDQNELKKNLELAYLQIAQTEAGNSSVQTDIEPSRFLAARATPSSRWYNLPVATFSVVVVISLSFTFVYHDAFSNVQNRGQAEKSATSLLGPAMIMRSDDLSASDTDLSAQLATQNTHVTRYRAVSQRQWGPLLVMSAPDKHTPVHGYDPLVKAQQESLLILGFDIGKADGHKGTRTREAIAEFRALYLHNSTVQLKDAALTVIMNNYANLARSDAAEFGIDRGVIAAIRLSSVRTGVDFAYLMKLAATESNFEPESKATTSSAVGLYQFTRDTWLNTLKKHGAKYGLLANYAARIKYQQTRSGYLRPVVSNNKLYKHLLALRKNPRLSAIMAAETTRDSQQTLSQLLHREPTETDLYMSHFLGTDAAATFLISLQQNPDANAAELYPEAAQSNSDIFHLEPGEPRTLNDVYAYFAEKFNINRYGDYKVNSSLWLAKN